MTERRESNKRSRRAQGMTSRRRADADAAFFNEFLEDQLTDMILMELLDRDDINAAEKVFRA
jgi:hypothetical protein